MLICCEDSRQIYSLYIYTDNDLGEEEEEESIYKVMYDSRGKHEKYRER